MKIYHRKNVEQQFQGPEFPLHFRQIVATLPIKPAIVITDVSKATSGLACPYFLADIQSGEELSSKPEIRTVTKNSRALKFGC